MSSNTHLHGLREIEELFPMEPLHELSDEGAARDKQERDALTHLASWLRAAADHVELGNWPKVMGCTIPRSPEISIRLSGSLMTTVSVTFSHPWGG